MAFHFPLQAVFHFRQSVEHQQELRLRTANQQVARARRVVEQFDERIRQVQLRQCQELGAGTTSAEMRFALTGEAARACNGRMRNAISCAGKACATSSRKFFS